MHIRYPRKFQTARQKQIMGRSEEDGRCRRHPEHRQSKGVCPFCLRDRLTHLSASSSSATVTLASSTTSSSPGSASPPNQVNTSWLHLRPGPDLKKSRSLAFAVGRPTEENKGKKEEEGKNEKDKKKKGSFWSKLGIGSDRRKEEDGSICCTPGH